MIENNKDVLTSIINTAENLGWKVDSGNNCIVFSKFSNLGELVCSGDNCIVFSRFSNLGELVYISIFGYKYTDEIIKKVYEYAEDFDADKHAEIFVNMRGENGIPTSLRESVKNADDVQDMLNKLSSALLVYCENEGKFMEGKRNEK